MKFTKLDTNGKNIIGNLHFEIKSIRNVPTNTPYPNFYIHEGMKLSEGAYITHVTKPDTIILGHTEIVLQSSIADEVVEKIMEIGLGINED